MKRARHITRWLATSVAVIALSLPSLAQRHAYHPYAARAQGPSHSAAPRNQGTGRQPQRHAGDWLRRYKDLPPGEQERALQNDPHFRSLPPARQRQLRQQLRYFSSLPPQQQEHILALIKRGEVFGGLTPEQRQQVLQIHNQIMQLPPDRQRMVRSAILDLRAMPPGQREQVIDSDRFRNNFSPQELGILREVTRLPLAPAEGGAEAPPQE
ncbi:MAG: DUF3106 domain-containing protein [Candidatus Sulfotelmatobacter sp.]